MRRFLLAAATSLLLAGCATLSPPPAKAPDMQRWHERRVQLEQLTAFTLQARLASSGGVAGKADLLWRQQEDDRFELRLSGPFGIGAVDISGRPDAVQVRSRDGSQFTTDPERWLREQLGWTLPVSRLRYWVLGLPTPGVPGQLEVNAAGEITRLEQDGWQIDYLEYQPAGRLSLPRRLQIAGSNVNVKLVADRWQDLPESVTPPTPVPAPGSP